MKRSVVTFSMISLMAYIVGMAFVTLFPQKAEAVPSFSRKYETSCSTCHTAWPLLNSTGRQFKEVGYKFPGNLQDMNIISDFLHLDKNLPMSAIIIARPYDKKKSGDRKIRALHEIEVIVAGSLYKDFSGFFELEAEDEHDFKFELPVATVGYHPTKAINVQFSFSPVLWADPYDTLSSPRRLTRGRNSVIDQRFGGADNNGKLRDSRQTVALYGRPVDMLYYSIGYSGAAKDTEGVNAKNLHARLALDIIPEATVGLFWMDGSYENAGTDLDFSRIALDAQVEFSNIRLMGAYLKAKDDIDPSGDAENNALYLEAMYIIEKGDRPLVVPLIRYDSYEKNNGNDQYDELTFNVSYYFIENIKGMVEYWTQTSVPSGKTKDNRLTVQFYVAF